MFPRKAGRAEDGNWQATERDSLIPSMLDYKPSSYNSRNSYVRVYIATQSLWPTGGNVIGREIAGD
jgi:hypothetical protein